MELSGQPELRELLRNIGRLCLTLAEPPAPPPIPETRSGDRLLTVSEASRRLGVKRGWLYRNHPHLPFTRVLGRRNVRFSEAGLEEYMRSMPAHGPGGGAA